MTRLSVLFRVLLWAALIPACTSDEPIPAEHASPTQAAELEAAPEVRNLIKTIDYIGTDWVEAVDENGNIQNPAEYDEMVEFSATAQRLLTKALATHPDVAEDSAATLKQQTKELAALVAKRARAEKVQALCRSLSKAIVPAFGVQSTPTARPEFVLGRKVYAERCASCHGATGRGDGPLGAGLDPAPRDFHEAAVMEASAPFKFYNILRTGIEGTAMVAYPDLDENEAWSVSFYLSALRYLPEAGAHSPAESWDALSTAEREILQGADLSVARMANSTDGELRSYLANVLHVPSAEASKTLAKLRAAAPYMADVRVAQASPSQKNGGGDRVEQGFTEAREQVARARQAAAVGAFDEAESALLEGYLYGFERTESSLRVFNKDLVLRIEGLFMEGRGFARQSAEAELAATVAELDRALVDAAASYQDARRPRGGWGDFVASLVIILREGLEAFLVVAALLALLASMGAHGARIWVHAGWVSAIAAGFVTYYLLEMVLQLSGAARESVEAVATGIAVVLLFYTGFWLLSQAEHQRWNRFVKSRTKELLSTGRLWGLFTIAFIAVYREAAETVLFYAALSRTASSTLMVVSGFIAGVAMLATLCWAILRLNVKLPLRQFFLATSTLMVALSIVLAGKTVHEVVEAGFLDPTPIAGLGSIDLLGIYPFAETLMAQAALLGLAVIVTLAVRAKKKQLDGEVNPRSTA